MPQSTAGSVSSAACSRTVAGSSVAPWRGSRATSSAQVTTAIASVAAIATCQSSVSATILASEVEMTIATENAAYTTEMAMDTRFGPTSSGR